MSYSSKRLVDIVRRIWEKEPKPGKLLSKLLSTKFRDWKYEDEVRVFVEDHGMAPLDGPNFLDFADHMVPREVILGARCTDSVEDIKAIAIASGLSVSVIKARLAFRTFKVVQDRRNAIDTALL